MKEWSIGVDPGKTGALALLKNGELIDVWDMPATQKLQGKGEFVSPQLLISIVDEMLETCGGVEFVRMCFIELVHAMPKQGGVSSFSFGRSLGAVEVAIASRFIPTTYVTPQAWKKQCGLMGKDKDMARTLCLSLYPKLAHLFKRKKDTDRADATLIGAYNV